jgi:hypothetical protein
MQMMNVHEQWYEHDWLMYVHVRLNVMMVNQWVIQGNDQDPTTNKKEHIQINITYMHMVSNIDTM